MEIIAIIFYLSYLVSAALAIYLCVILFRHYHQFGWLLVSVTFLQPFWLLLLRAINGHVALSYMTVGVAADGSQKINYRIDFPIFYVVAIIGLYLLVKKTRNETTA